MGDCVESLAEVRVFTANRKALFYVFTVTQGLKEGAEENRQIY